jgi:tellurite resistance protein TerC
VVHILILWGAFIVVVVGLLMVDLLIFNKRLHTVSVKEALVWSGVWISLALLFNVAIRIWLGHEAALQFLTGYLIEKSLSVDNLFVFVLLFSYFKVPARYQHEVLYWGILGALFMRGVLIILGAALVAQFHWLLLFFGAFLMITGIKMAFEKDEKKEVHPERNIVVRFFKSIFPVTDRYYEGKFVVTVDGKRYATLLMIVLIVVETTDLVFAFDSIPAVFAVTTDSFIIFTSNVFAILGLRSLYFALAGVMGMFYYLRHGLALILTFIGVKMLIDPFYHMRIGVALGTVGTVLILAIGASLLRSHRQHRAGKERRKLIS